MFVCLHCYYREAQKLHLSVGGVQCPATLQLGSGDPYAKEGNIFLKKGNWVELGSRL